MANGPNADRRRNRKPKPQTTRQRHLRFVPIAIVLAGLVLGYALGWQEHLSFLGLAEDRGTLRRLVADNPVLAPAGFIILYAVAVAFSFPVAAMLTVIGGFLFGWLAGALYAIVAATTGGTTLFLAARTAFGGLLRDRAGDTAGKLARGFEKNAFSYLLVLRLAPFIPFSVASIAPAFFDVRLRTFLAATLLGILPGAFSFAWLGHGLDSVLVAAAASGRQITVSDLVTPEITVAFLALTLVAALATIVRKVRRQQTY